MAAVAPTAEHATNLLQKLSLDSQAKKEEAVNANKKYGSANGVPASNPGIQSGQPWAPSLQDFADPNNTYYHPNGYSSTAYYYGGFDGSANEWDSRYGNREGEVPQGVYADIYQGYGYAPYGPYASPASPAPSVDNQLYGAQHYQYPSPYFQAQAPTALSHGASQTPASQSELSTSISAGQPLVPGNSAKANSNVIEVSNGSSGLWKPGQHTASVTSNGSYARGPLQGGLSTNGYSYSGGHSPFQWYEYPSVGHHRAGASSISSYASNGTVRNQSQRSSANLMRQTPGMGPTTPSYLNRLYPNNRLYGQYGQYGSALKAGFGSTGYNSRNSGRYGYVVDNKNKSRGRGSTLGFGNENQDGFTELNRGPRSGSFKSLKPLGPTVTIAVKGQALPPAAKQDLVSVPDAEQLNREDFPVAYTDAKFFVIKSYSEDDIHKSIKYNVWASTPNGNKKLDAAYREAQGKTGGCPIFLLFSVNTSGQFVGVAEMVGPVDFDKTVGYWQQDKWTGCFNLKWHVVKDVPNSILKHISLENNDNKPVTNSRDTQEVKLEQGLELLKIFKDHVGKTSILDDFEFYENRQKVMEEKRTKQQQDHGPVQAEKKDAATEKKDADAKTEKPAAGNALANGS